MHGNKFRMFTKWFTLNCTLKYSLLLVKQFQRAFNFYPFITVIISLHRSTKILLYFDSI